MALDDLLGHGEAHAQAARLAGTTGVGTPKTTEDARQIILGDTDARIRNRDVDVLAVAEHRHHDPAALGGIAHGVTQEVDDTLRDHVGVRLDNVVVALRLIRKAQTQVAVGKQALLAIHNRSHERHHVHRLQVERRGAVFHTRQVEHLLYQTGQSARLGGNRLQMLVVGGIYPILHGLDRCEHGHKRGAKLVRNIRGQALLVLHILLERRGHLVEGLSQLIDLIVAAQARSSGQIAVAYLLGRAGDAMDRLGEHTRHERSDNDRDANGHNRGERHGVKGLLPKRRIRLGKQGIGANRPQFDLAHMLAGGRYDLDVGNAVGVGGSRRDRAVRRLFAARTIGRRLVFAHIGSGACRGPRVVVDDNALFIDDLYAKIIGHQTRCRDRTQFPRGPGTVFLI